MNKKKVVLHVNLEFTSPDYPYKKTRMYKGHLQKPLLLCGVRATENMWWSSIYAFMKDNKKNSIKCKKCAKSRKIPMLWLKELNNED